MALLKVGLPTFFLIGVSVLLVLTSHVFQAWDPSVGRHNGRDEFGSLIVSQLNTSLSRLAVPFGAKTILRNSLSNVLLVNTSHSKRDGWSDAVAEGRRLYNTVLNGRTLPSPFDGIHWLTGVYPDGSEDSVGWSVVAQLPQGSSGSASSDDSLSDSDGEDPDIATGNRTPEGYEDIFNQLGIPNGEVNQNWIALQNLRFTNCYGSGKQATRGAFSDYYNVPGRTIVAFHNVSPVSRLKQYYRQQGEPLPPDWERDLPFVSRLSDVLWIIWAKLSRDQGAPPGNLKYVFRHHVITMATQQVIRQAANGDIPGWPGQRFTPADDQYMALLGTAHGKGVANLVAQHRNDLGSKNIESITIFATQSFTQGVWNHMLFTLTD